MDWDEMDRELRNVTVPLNARIDRELDAWCDAYAMDHGLTKQAVAEEALKEYRRRYDP